MSFTDSGAPAAVPAARFGIPLGDEESLYDFSSAAVAISPDGSRIAYAVNRGVERSIHVRALDEMESHPLPGTERGSDPIFFSRWRVDRVRIGGEAANVLLLASHLARWKSHRDVSHVAAILLAGLLGFGQTTERRRDQWLARPVDDRTFETYLEFFRIDERLPFEAKLDKTESEDGVLVEHVSFQSTRGERVTAHYFRSERDDPTSRPAIIILHGGGAGGKNRAQSREAAKTYVRGGWNVLNIDFHHWGDRADGLFTTYTEIEKHDLLYNQPAPYLDWIIQSVRDVRRSFDFLVEEKGLNPKRIGLLGLSRGAVVATIAAAVETRLAAVALLFGGHFDALEREHLPAACPANYVGRIHPRPLLALNALHDNDFDREASVEPLLGLAGPSLHAIWTDGGHGYATDEDRAEVMGWLRANLK